MTIAHRLDYIRQELEITGFRQDREISVPDVALYVPKLQLLLQPRNRPKSGSLHDRYLAFRGNPAEVEYRTLLSRGVQITQMTVDEEFISWANSLFQAQNPSKGIAEMLQPRT